MGWQVAASCSVLRWNWRSIHEAPDGRAIRAMSARDRARWPHAYRLVRSSSPLSSRRPSQQLDWRISPVSLPAKADHGFDRQSVTTCWNSGRSSSPLPSFLSLQARRPLANRCWKLYRVPQCPVRSTGDDPSAFFEKIALRWPLRPYAGLTRPLAMSRCAASKLRKPQGVPSAA